jgi:hypothetical protein
VKTLQSCSRDRSVFIVVDESNQTLEINKQFEYESRSINIVATSERWANYRKNGEGHESLVEFSRIQGLDL